VSNNSREKANERRIAELRFAHNNTINNYFCFVSHRELGACMAYERVDVCIGIVVSVAVVDCEGVRVLTHSKKTRTARCCIVTIYMLTSALIAVAIIDTRSMFIQQRSTHHWCCLLLYVCFGVVVIAVQHCSDVHVCVCVLVRCLLHGVCWTEFTIQAQSSQRSNT
jgi:hypothetical protein